MVAIDPSAAFAKAIRTHLPNAADQCRRVHLAKLANDMVTTVRQRLLQQYKNQRGRSGDLSWANRLLLHGADTLSPPGGHGFGRSSPTTIRPESSPPRGASGNNSAGCWPTTSRSQECRLYNFVGQSA
ncbi:transposase [Rhodococcus sp. JVH1]|nr:transposase [Rhodococcus sp. JVH1]